jgi:hypothetical protein
MPMNPRLLRPRASGFNPRSVANLAFWLDFADSSTVTLSGTAITSVTDKSGNNRTASQSTGNNQPAIASSVRNGKSAAQFDGVNDALDVAYGSAQSQAVTVFAVINATGAGGSNQGRVFERAGQGPILLRDNTNTSLSFGAPWTGATGNARQRTAASSVSLNTWYLYGVRYTGGFVTETDIQPRLNRASSTAGLVGAGDSSSTTQSSTINIGNRDLSNGYDRGFAGYIGEILWYSRSLSTTEVSSVESYLAKKWGF